MYKIPFNRPSTVGPEFEYMQEAIRQGHLSGDGKFTHKCNDLLENLLGVSKALLTSSCTHALEMCALLLDIQPGDEIIIPSFTFVSSVNAFVLRGARPVFVDIRPDTLNIDEKLIESAITPRTKTIVVVHYAGISCEMDTIMEIANRHNIPVVEDNAHGLLGKYKGRFLGTFGSFATQSFHETKNFQCGEGGALLINDPQYIERAEIIREKGTDRSRFFRGQVDKYTWVDIGSSYLPSELQAAFLFAQLEARTTIQAARAYLWTEYHENLVEWSQQMGIRLPIVPEECDQAYHMYYLLFHDLDHRQMFIKHMKQKRILSVFHYLPLHVSKMGQYFGGRAGDCPITEALADRLARLPLYNSMTDSDQKYVIDAIRSNDMGVATLHFEKG